MSDIRVGHAELLRFFTDIFAAKGMNTEGAATLAEVLVWANLRGVDGHGVSVTVPASGRAAARART